MDKLRKEGKECIVDVCSHSRLGDARVLEQCASRCVCVS